MLNLANLWGAVTKGLSLLHGRLGNVEQDIATVKADVEQVKNAYNELKSSGVLSELESLVGQLGSAAKVSAPAPQPQGQPQPQQIDPATGLSVQQ